ncbi:fumarylacetoacetate hydrolase family protein [Novosphingobium sp. KA1]|uniref:fumarylacetoacetate hydrolase family protein n=1 Tax=Novosphingobium sp. (strain KA1) TaxID=164608 RepID=UPI001A906A3D|nr:fumarylacetoacetate hydrolase family protein [Novosphingobium sp. KA1]QSR19342.1 5-carboxymethyl-2-hydroxymuconate isomerase [Novosphingobium sp. KA1]
MRLVSYKQAGKASWGALTADDRVVDLADVAPTLRAALEGDLVPASIEGREPGPAIDEIELLPVVPDPDKILCVGIAYHAHRIETGRDESAAPIIFTRFANSQVGHGLPLLRPPESDQLDYEGEIAVVIGKGGRRIEAADAWDHVAGFAPYCDATIRDWQHKTGQWTPGKNFVGTGGFGPWLVTRDEIPDGKVLTLVTRLNGEEVQRTTTDLLIFSIPEIIAFCSTFTELSPGDVIATGTPGGVGGKRNPPLWMKPGDVLEVEVSDVGTLRHPIEDEV